jgi:hypothetical protein
LTDPNEDRCGLCGTSLTGQRPRLRIGYDEMVPACARCAGANIGAADDDRWLDLLPAIPADCQDTDFDNLVSDKPAAAVPQPGGCLSVDGCDEPAAEVHLCRRHLDALRQQVADLERGRG